MDKFENYIDKVIQKVLTEAAEQKASEVSEKLHGKQKEIDKNKNGKIDAEDFKLLRKKHTKEGFEDEIDIDRMDLNPSEEDIEIGEFDPRDKSWEEIKAHTGAPDYSEIDEQGADPEYIDPKDGELDEFDFEGDTDESTPGDYEGDEEAEEEAEELSAQEPTYVGMGLKDNKPAKMFASFNDDHGWFDERDRNFGGDFDFDYDEEEFDEFEPMFKKYGKDQRWFAPGEEGKKFFDAYKNKFGGPLRIRTRRMTEGDMEEQEKTEGNAFTGALAKAKEEGKDSFEVDGKKFNVKEAEDKWIQKTKMKKGALHKKLGVPEGSKIPKSKLNSLKKELTAKAKGDKKLSAEDLKTLKQVNMALTLGGLKESNSNLNSLQLNENELIDLIEKIVVEQEVNKTKGNIADKTPKGLEVAEKVHREDGKENKSALEAVTKKLREYLKDASKGNFEPNPKNFPKGNGELAKMDKKAYTPDADVEEYIEEFSYGGGMENLDYDEIKPNEEWMENTIVGSSKTGNSQKYANAVETELGEKINKKRKKNMFSQEKKNSYKRVDQPTSGDNKSQAQKDSDKLFAKLESTEDKNNKLVVEQLEKMKHLFSYSQKTQ